MRNRFFRISAFFAFVMFVLLTSGTNVEANSGPLDYKSYWVFEEGTGTIIADQNLTTGNDLTICADQYDDRFDTYFAEPTTCDNPVVGTNITWNMTDYPSFNISGNGADYSLTGRGIDLQNHNHLLAKYLISDPIFTYSVWANFDGFSDIAYFDNIYLRYEGNGNMFVWFWDDSIGTGDQTDCRSDVAVFPEGSWTHVAVTRNSSTDGTEPRIYVNGENVTADFTCTRRTAAGTYKGPFFGAGSDSDAEIRMPFNGEIDEIIYYDRKLSFQEVKDIYNYGISAEQAPVLSNIDIKDTTGDDTFFFGEIIDYFRVNQTDETDTNLTTYITVTDPEGDIKVDNQPMINITGDIKGYESDLYLDAVGTWNVNFTVTDSTNLTTTLAQDFEVSKVNITTSGRIYGYDFQKFVNFTTLNTTIDQYGYYAVEVRINSSDNWTNDVAPLIRKAKNNSQIIILTWYDDLSNITESVNYINDHYADITGADYYNGIRELKVYVDDAVLDNSSNSILLNNVTKIMFQSVSNRFPIYVRGYNHTDINTNYASVDDDPYITASNSQEYYTEELYFIRNSLDKTRIYYDMSSSEKNLAMNYQINIIDKFRDDIQPISFTRNTNQTGELRNYDFVVINNYTDDRNFTIDLAGPDTEDLPTDIYDFTNKEIIVLNMNWFFTQIDFSVDALSASLFYLTDIINITVSDSNVINLITDDVGVVSGTTDYSQNSTNAFQFVSSSANPEDARLFLFDPTYEHAGFYVWYGTNQFEAISNWSRYNTVIIGDYNNVTWAEQIAAESETYGYVSVNTYGTDNYPAGCTTGLDCTSWNRSYWITARESDIELWTNMSNMQIFIDGLDIGAVNDVDGLFGESLVELTDYARVTKGRKAMLNTYTAYLDYANLGDSTMRESACARWDGTVSNPVYSYEDINLEVQRAEFHNTHNKPVYAQAFGNITDYEKAHYCFVQTKVLYGDLAEYSYNQPLFEYTGAEDDFPWNYYKYPDIGSQVEDSYTVDGDIYSRRFQNGLLKVNVSSREAEFVTDREITNMEFCSYFYDNDDDADAEGFMHFIINDNMSRSFDINDSDLSAFTKTWKCSDIDTEYFEPSGFYELEFYYLDNDANYLNNGGLFMYHADQEGSDRYSFYDQILNGHPSNDETDYTAYATGDNWAMNFTINGESQGTSIDTLNTVITRNESGTDNLTVTFTSESSWPLNIIDKVINMPYEIFRGIIVNGTYLNYTNTSTCITSSARYANTTVNGEIWKACYYDEDESTDGYSVRVVVPSLSTKNYTVDSTVKETLFERTDVDFYFNFDNAEKNATKEALFGEGSGVVSYVENQGVYQYPSILYYTTTSADRISTGLGYRNKGIGREYFEIADNISGPHYQKDTFDYFTGLENFSMGLWFSPREPFYDQYTLFRGSGPNILVDFTSTTSDGILATVPLSNGSTVTLQNSSVNIPEDTWNHVALTRNGSRIKLYYNGQVVAQEGIAEMEVVFDTSGLNLNLWDESGGSFQLTYADEVFFDDDAFTDDEITALYTRDAINRQPYKDYIYLTPEILLANTTITAATKISDHDGEYLNINYSLVVNDAFVESQYFENQLEGFERNVTFSYSVDVLDEVYISLEYSDNQYTVSNTSETTIVRAENSAPTMTAVTIQPDFFIGQDDNVVGYCEGSDAEDDSVTYLYDWYINGISVKSGTAENTEFSGFADDTQIEVDTLSYTQTTEGDTLVFSCAAKDALDTGNYTNTTEYEIFTDNNFIPEIETIQISPSGSRDTNQDFYINISASDFDGQNVTIEFREVINDALQPIQTSSVVQTDTIVNVGNISSSSTKAGDSVYVRARAYDEEAYSSWENSNVVTIENTPPTMDSASIIGSPEENRTLQGVCVASDIDSEQTVSYTYNWYKDGTLFSENTDNTLDFNYTQATQSWILECQASDGTNTSEKLNSSSVLITDTQNAPVLVSTSIEGGIDELTSYCLANDQDGDLLNYTFRLYENDTKVQEYNITLVNQSEQQQYTFSKSYSVGDNYTTSCQVVDENNDGTTLEVNSSTLTVPSLTFAYNVEEVEATSIEIAWTGNHDNLTVYFDGEFEFFTSTQISRVLDGLYPNTTYEISIIPSKDGFFFDRYRFNVTTEISDNDAPVMQSVIISPTTAYTDNALTGYCRATDTDNLALRYNHTWYVNEEKISSGLSAETDEGVRVNIGSILSTNYDAFDNITLSCFSDDEIFSSSELNTTVQILNSEPVIRDEFVLIQPVEEKYACNHVYTDADDDAEIPVTYKWYLNETIIPSETNMTVNTSSFSFDDELICQVDTGDAYHNVSKNSSVFTVGDFEEPVMSDVIAPRQVFTDSSAAIGATCTDNVLVADNYPKIRFVNPNLVEEEYSILFSSGDDYQRYLTFPIDGTYTNVEFECRDGNANSVTIQLGYDILAQQRETVINVGAGGGTAGEDEEAEPEFLRNITTFSIEPDETNIIMTPGSTRRLEFRLTNEDIVDVEFQLEVNDTDAYEFITFSETDGKTTSFIIERSGSLGTNSEFIRYIVQIPEGTPSGEYTGFIKVNAFDQEGYHVVNIEVRQSLFSVFVDFLTTPFIEFEVGDTQTPTGAVTGEEVETRTAGITPLATILVFGGLISGFFIFRRLRAT